jgi:uncharacterized membrane protein YidH (DUF202 family)
VPPYCMVYKYGRRRPHPQCVARESFKVRCARRSAHGRDADLTGLEFSRHPDPIHDPPRSWLSHPILRLRFSMMLPSTSSELSPAPPLDSPSLHVRDNDIRPNEEEGDDDDDQVRLTRQQRTAVIAERASRHRGRNLDVGPVPPAPSPSPCCSTSRPPKRDDSVVPAVAAVAAEGALHVPFSLSLTLRNTGSVARDHLASERTFLAYVRTSLSFASAGVGPSLFLSISLFSKAICMCIFIALVQLFRVSVSASANDPISSHTEVVVASYARPLGATLVAFGMAVLVLGEFFVLSFPIPPLSPSPSLPLARTHS